MKPSLSNQARGHRPRLQRRTTVGGGVDPATVGGDVDPASEEKEPTDGSE